MTGEWRRADLGDLPTVGSTITLVEYAEGSNAVKVYSRMAVAVALDGARPGVYGSALPGGDEIELPGRPEGSTGKVTLWRETT